MPVEIKSFLSSIISIFYYILLARIIITFFRSAISSNEIVMQLYRVLYTLTEPLLRPLRNMIPPLRSEMGYVDLSPLALLVILIILRRVLWAL